jgi:hypothetical protein
MDYMVSLHFIDFISWGILDNGPLYLRAFRTRPFHRTRTHKHAESESEVFSKSEIFGLGLQRSLRTRTRTSEKLCYTLFHFDVDHHHLVTNICVCVCTLDGSSSQTMYAAAAPLLPPLTILWIMKHKSIVVALMVVSD